MRACLVPTVFISDQCLSLSCDFFAIAVCYALRLFCVEAWEGLYVIYLCICVKHGNIDFLLPAAHFLNSVELHERRLLAQTFHSLL